MLDSPKELLILVVEDNPTHTQQIEAALNESLVNHRIVAIADGNDTLDFLHRRGSYQDAHRPDLILLDLNLPGKNGKEILTDLKNDPNLRRIPVVVLTTSDRETDILNSYSLQGNCYVIKSNDMDQLFQIVKRIEEFWLGIVTLPIE